MHDQCKQNVKRSLLAQHLETECLHRQVSCTFCNEKRSFHALKVSIWQGSDCMKKFQPSQRGWKKIDHKNNIYSLFLCSTKIVFDVRRVSCYKMSDIHNFGLKRFYCMDRYIIRHIRLTTSLKYNCILHFHRIMLILNVWKLLWRVNIVQWPTYRAKIWRNMSKWNVKKLWSNVSSRLLVAITQR